MQQVIPHWLTNQAYLSPDQTAIEQVNGNTITFHELMEKSQQFARRLVNIGVTKGVHVGILSTNNVDMAAAIHALSYLGAVSVLLNTRLTKEELSYQINDGAVTCVLTCDSLEQETKEMNFAIPVYTFTEINQMEEIKVSLVKELQLDDIFTIIYTSGTTGFPKGVVHTYGNHWWSAVGSALNLGIDAKDKWLIVLPIFHVGGLSTLIKSVVYGMPVYILEKFNEQIVHDAIMERGVTIVSVVTVMMQQLLALLGDSMYPQAFRCMLLGGGPAPESLLEHAKARNIPVFQSYGMTETASQIVTLSPADALEKIGSAGKPLMPAQLRINNTEPGHTGEIYVKGPMVTKGYFNKQEATDQVMQDGWLATGDLGYLDAQGFLYVVERRKDLIISGGENIYPSEIESVLAGMEYIREAGVTGVSDERWGQVPIAFIVKSDAVTIQEITDYLEKHLAKYKIPKQFYIVDSLPRNASNKLLRNKLLELR